MNVIVAIEHRFASTPDGAVWTESQFPHSFWMRYLEVFDQVRVVARVRKVASVSPMWKRADGERVLFVTVPYYIGPWQYLLKAGQVKHTARNAVEINDAVILRVSSQIAQCLEPVLRQNGHPYAVEVVADPYDVFAPSSLRHPLRPFFRWLFPRMLLSTCARACAAAYVTESALQRRYPPAPNAFSTHYSSVELPEQAFAKVSRPAQKEIGTFTLICVGTLAQLYKAQDVLINAVAVGIKEGLDLQLILVGDGKHRGELEMQAQNLGLEKKVCFRGRLTSGEAVRAELEQADLFVLPSRSEGLPRALIEAMAQGLPCIASTVGGISELLPPEDMVPPDDVAALVNKIREVLTNPERMARMSVRNLAKAKGYREETLRQRRNNFYSYLRAQTQAWKLMQEQGRQKDILLNNSKNKQKTLNYRKKYEKHCNYWSRLCWFARCFSNG